MVDDESIHHIIIDNGSSYTKAGFSGEEGPRTIFPTIIGYPKSSDGKKNYYIGTDAEDKIEELKITYPIENGTIKYWDDMEKIWEHIFTNELKADQIEHNIMVTGLQTYPKEAKELIVEIMFEKYNVPGLYIANPGELIAYSAGKFTGLVVDFGDRFCDFTPVSDGYSLSSIIHQNLGGNDLTEYIVKALLKDGYNFLTKSSKLIANIIKEKACYVALDYEEELKQVEYFNYELPDGKHIIIKNLRITCPEILFRPDIAGIKGGICSISNNCYNSIQKCDIDLRKDLYTCIILSGGTSMFNGLQERLTKEIKALAPESIKEEVKVIALPERKYATWIGGSVLSSISTFEKMWITKTEYEENGVNIVHKKCP